MLPVLKYRFHIAHYVVREAPTFLSRITGKPVCIIRLTYFGVTPDLYNLVLSGYVILTSLESFCGGDFSLGSPGQMAKVLTF